MTLGYNPDLVLLVSEYIASFGRPLQSVMVTAYTKRLSRYSLDAVRDAIEAIDHGQYPETAFALEARVKALDLDIRAKALEAEHVQATSHLLTAGDGSDRVDIFQLRCDLSPLKGIVEFSPHVRLVMLKLFGRLVVLYGNAAGDPLGNAYWADMAKAKSSPARMVKTIRRVPDVAIVAPHPDLLAALYANDEPSRHHAPALVKGGLARKLRATQSPLTDSEGIHPSMH